MLYLEERQSHFAVTQIASDSGWEKLSVADAINQLGVISGVGVKNGQDLGFIMVASSP